MYQPSPTTARPRTKRSITGAAAAAFFSVALGASGPALAAPHGGGGFHGGGFHGGFRPGGFHGGGFHAERFDGGFHGRHFRHGFGFGFFPSLGVGFALGAAYPWGWGSYAPYGYYGYPYPDATGQVWYYCSNPPGYYPYVSQCYAPWQALPAS